MGRSITSPIHSYEAAQEFMLAHEDKRRRRVDRLKLAGNTYLIRGPSQADMDSVLPPGTFEDAPLYFAVRLHSTDVVTFYANGDVKLDTGGWATKTTAHRMRGFLPGARWPLDAHVKRRPFMHWSLRTAGGGPWTLECERISFPVGEDRTEHTLVKSFQFSETLTLQRAPRTAGGYKLKRSEALA